MARTRWSAPQQVLSTLQPILSLPNQKILRAGNSDKSDNPGEALLFYKITRFFVSSVHPRPNPSISGFFIVCRKELIKSMALFTHSILSLLLPEQTQYQLERKNPSQHSKLVQSREKGLSLEFIYFPWMKNQTLSCPMVFSPQFDNPTTRLFKYLA